MRTIRQVPGCFGIVLIAGLWLLAMLGSRAIAQDKIFPPDAVVDITKQPYNVVPSDGNDDTAIIQRAITDVVGTGKPLYFPAGVYEISDSLVAKNAKGQWEAHLTLQGESREKTIFRLKDHAAGFDQPAQPRGVIVTASHWDPGDPVNGDGGGNKAFRNNLFDLTIETGSGNPGAIGIDYAVSNWGAVERVNVRSVDEGVAGIALRRSIPGPGLLSDVAIEGFNVGVDLHDVQYGLTMDRVSVKHQRIAGVRTDRNILSIRRLTSDNHVPAVQVMDVNGSLTLIDSFLADLRGPGTIDCVGTMLLCGVQSPAGSVRFAQPSKPARTAERNGTDRLPSSQDPAAYWNDNLADWAAVGPRLAGENDDTAAIQRAIDAGKSTVYFPIGRTYFLSDTVIIRAAVKQILGMGAEISLGAAKEPFSDIKHPRPLFRIDPTSAGGVVIENCFFNAQYPGEVIFENNSPEILVIRHCGGWIGSNGHRHSYRNTHAADGGYVFIDDCFLPGWAFSSQTVWAKQFNPENPDGDGVEPQVLNSSSKLWILGFKTEGPAPFITTRAGGVTELFGGYNYLSATNAPTLPGWSVPYVVEDATASLTFTADNFRDSDYDVYIRLWRGGKVIKELKRSDLPSRNGVQGDRSVAVPLQRVSTQ